MSEVSTIQKGPSSEYRDLRADDLRIRYHTHFGGEEIPVPVEAIAEDLLGMSVRGVRLTASRDCSIRRREPCS